jgi:hypothetical protein
MPVPPTNGGRFLIQSKATGKQLALPINPGGDIFHPGGGGVFTEVHIVPDDRGAVWQIEFVEGYDYYRFTTESVFPWSTGDPDSGFGRLDSNRERQVYAHPPNDGGFQLWRPTPLADGYFLLVNRATGFALDGNNEDIYTHDVNDGNFQHWGFFPA